MNKSRIIVGLVLALFSMTAFAQQPLSKVQTKNAMRMVADWQIANPNTSSEHEDWA